MRSPSAVTTYDAFKYYNSLKFHFNNDSYDCFKYNFKAKNISSNRFLKTKDKYQYAKLASKFPNSSINLVNFIVSNMVYSDNKYWVGDLLSTESDNTYGKWLKINESLTYVFKKDINTLSNFQFNDLLSTKSDQTYPVIIKELLSGSIHIETVAILNTMTGFIKTEDKNIKDPVVWPDLRRLILKYSPFVLFDKEKCKNIVISSFTFE